MTTARNELYKILLLALSVTYLFFLFVCESNISVTVERICAKFTGKTCLVPHLEEFECQGHQGQKNVLCTPITPSGSDRMEYARCK